MSSFVVILLLKREAFFVSEAACCFLVVFFMIVFLLSKQLCLTLMEFLFSSCWIKDVLLNGCFTDTVWTFLLMKGLKQMIVHFLFL